MAIEPDSVAGLIARLLKRRGVERVFALCGGHIMPIWMRLDAEGIRIVDVRDERAAVHMAQAHAELTGELGVALVTAGPTEPVAFAREILRLLGVYEGEVLDAWYRLFHDSDAAAYAVLEKAGAL